MLLDEGPHLEEQVADFEAQGLGFGGAGDDAAVVAAEDNDGHAVEGELESARAADAEVIAVNEGEHGRFVVPIRLLARQRCFDFAQHDNLL